MKAGRNIACAHLALVRGTSSTLDPLIRPPSLAQPSSIPGGVGSLEAEVLPALKVLSQRLTQLGTSAMSWEQVSGEDAGATSGIKLGLWPR